MLKWRVVAVLTLAGLTACESEESKAKRALSLEATVRLRELVIRNLDDTIGFLASRKHVDSVRLKAYFDTVQHEQEQQFIDQKALRKLER